MSMLRVLGSVFYLIMSSGLLWIAFKQLNDPDPAFWIPIYVTAGVLSLLIATALGWRTVVALVTIATASYAIYLGVVYLGGYSATPMYSDKPASELPWYKIEEPREMVGLLVTAVIVGSQLLCIPFLKRRAAATTHASSE